MGAMAAMIAASALTTVSTVWQSETQRAQAGAQADALEAQAQAVRRQNDYNRQVGEIEAQEIDRQKIRLRREFEEAQGRNRSLLAAGNVAMDSGSALDVAQGNINRFGEELGENRYSVALKRWETGEQAKQGEYQARLYESQASYLNATKGTLLTSLLRGGLAGAGTFAGMYGASGLGGASQPSTTFAGQSKGILVRPR